MATTVSILQKASVEIVYIFFIIFIIILELDVMWLNLAT